MSASVHQLYSDPQAPRSLIGDIEAEQAIIGSALLNNAVLASCRFLEAEHFAEPVHGRIWKGLRRRHEAGQLADPVTLRAAFEQDPALKDLGGARYLADLCRRAESIISAAEYARIVVGLARRRGLAEAAQGILDRIEREPEADAAEIAAAFAPAVDRVSVDGARTGGRTIEQVAEEIAADLLRPADLWSTGLPLLDDAIGGGTIDTPNGPAAVPFGYVIGVEARPAGFKTGTCHTLAVNAASRGVQVCYLALEMGSKRLTQRMLAHLGGFKRAMFQHRDAETVRRMGEALALAPRSLIVEDCQGATFSRVKQIASEHLTRHSTRLFFLDYYQLVQPDSSVDSRQQHLEEVAYWLQAFAYKHGVTWVVASQQNREGYALGGDGLLRACDWLCQINKLDVDPPVHHPDFGDVEALWLDVRKARDGGGDPVGGPTAKAARLFIHPHGPHLAELPR